MAASDIFAYLDHADPLWWNLGFCALLVVAGMFLDELMAWREDGSSDSGA